LKELSENLTDKQLTEGLPVLNGSSIGAHIRHILEFYVCLLESSNNNTLNYDNRKRDSTIEVFTKKCVLIIDQILQGIIKYEQDFEITLCADYSTNEAKDIVTVKTTFFRELLYNIEHLVHHLAIIKIGVRTLKSKVAMEALKRGDTYNILEVNGVGGEPTHIYDSETNIIQAWKDLCFTWRVAAKIAAINFEKGFEKPTYRKAKTKWKLFTSYKTKLYS